MSAKSSIYIPTSTFDTQAYQDKDRMEAYRDSIGVVFDVDGFENNTQDFSAIIKTYLLSEVLLVDCQTAGQFFRRPRHKIARDGIDHLIIQIFLEGKTTSIDGESECSSETGNLIVIDGAREWEAYNPNFQNISLIIPRRLLAGKLKQDDAHHGRILNPQLNPMASLLYSHIISLHQNAPRIESRFAQALVGPSVDLVIATLNFESASTKYESQQSLNYALLFRVKNYIELNLYNSNLSVELIMHEFNLARSTLYRLFPRSEGGIMNYVKERRLKKAFKSLVMPADRSQSIAEIAFACGFENESSFTRSYKSYFGLTPRDTRHNPSLIDWEASTIPERLWESWFRSL